MADLKVSGDLKITEQAIEELVRHTAMQSYGVIGMAVSSWRARLKKLFNSTGSDQGVKAVYSGGAVEIDVFIVVEHGTNLREIAKNLADQISYVVHKHTLLKTDRVEVHVSKIKK